MRLSSRMKLVCLAWLCVTGVGLPAWSQDKAADIPIKRVVMFSSGVAFFEHGGKVDGNASVDLKFNVKDINDLLKSMVLQDLDGGKISTVSYGSKDPITRTLATFSIDLTRNPTLGDLLQQIRGEKIEIDAPTKISGVILGVETRKIAGGKDQVVETQFLNLLTDDGLRSVSLDNVGRIAIADKKLNDDLRQALLVLAAGKSSDKKAVSLSFLGQGQRNVRIGYIQESPIWKTSYRLVLEDDKAPFMQGWAIVENTTESDWNDVNLALVSGRPISFVMDLYQPLYVNRPVVEPELFASLRPRTYDQDLASADGDFKRAAEQAEKAKSEGFADRGMLRKAMAAAAPAAPPADAFAANGRFLAEGKGGGFGGLGGMNLQQGGQSVAQASDVGEMFRYEIAAPVKLGRGQSAMLPIVNESVQGEKVAIYNQGQHAKHPMSGLKLKNSTDLHLMQGPITVFDDGAYAGDAQIQDLPPSSERLISYALDLDTEVAPTIKAEPQQLMSVKINRGVVYISHKYARAKSYVIKNSGRRVKKVLIEQPIEQPWQLIEPKEATEKTRDLYRFAISAEPGKPASLEVKEEYSSGEQVAANNLNDGVIQYYLNAKVVSEEVKTALRELVRRKGQIAASAAKRQELDRQIAVIDQEQTRIRNNMAQLPKDSDLFRRYVGKFTEQEDQIDALRQKVTAALSEEQGLQKSLNDYLNGLDLK
jgi:polyhydroxyalkanoate synthesis regulator phasin